MGRAALAARFQRKQNLSTEETQHQPPELQGKSQAARINATSCRKCAGSLLLNHATSQNASGKARADKISCRADCLLQATQFQAEVNGNLAALRARSRVTLKKKKMFKGHLVLALNNFYFFLMEKYTFTKKIQTNLR